MFRVISEERKRAIFERYKQLRGEALDEAVITEAIREEFAVTKEELALIVGEFR